jgi:hypothetical protein
MRKWWKGLGRQYQFAVVTLVVSVLATLPAYFAFFRPSTSTTISAPTTSNQAPFRVSAFEVRRKMDIIKANVIVDEEGTKEPDQMGAVLIDVTVKNTGPSTTVVTGAEFRVNVMERIASCKPEGGPLQISGYYTAQLPYPLPQTPFTTRRSIRREIKPNHVDRFVLSVGPKTVSMETLNVYLYQVDVLIHHDDPSTPNPLPAGTALLSSPIYSGERFGESEYRPLFGPLLPASDQMNKLYKYNDCIKDNRERAKRFFQLSGHRSPSVDAVEAAWKN